MSEVINNRTLIIHQARAVLVGRIFIPLALLLGDLFFAYPFLTKGSVTTAIFLTVLTLSALWIISKYYVWSKKSLQIGQDMLVDYDQINIFKKVITKVKVNEINAVSVKRSGLFQHVFRLANIYIVYNDGRTRIDFFYVSNPTQLKNYFETLMAAHPNSENKINQSDEEIIKYLRKIRQQAGERKFQEIISRIGSEEISEKVED